MCLSLAADDRDVRHLPMTFQPTQDQDSAPLTIEMVPGTTLDETELVVRSVAGFLQTEPDVESVYSRAALSAMAASRAIFKEKKSRRARSSKRSLAPTLAQIPDARVSFRSQQRLGLAAAAT
jgi:multidrug efflux pump subunit AcrB